MRDFDIRPLLRKTVLQSFYNDESSKVVEEMQLPIAGSRIDMAVINGHFHGFEIKSAQDTLQRLPGQVASYSYVFDYLTIVTEEKYFKKIVDLVPEWVGVIVCDESTETIISVIRKGEKNPNTNGFYIAKLLWRDEIIEILNSRQIQFKKKARNWILCELLAQQISVGELSQIVREKLKSRQDWKLQKAIH